ncbi:hypothetical protein TYRP_012280 [Tyrophagus putrescentiae]|nr:hypothetical protein TYRP_012280 [Tyrophagus putrescentiae]
MSKLSVLLLLAFTALVATNQLDYSWTSAGTKTAQTGDDFIVTSTGTDHGGDGKSVVQFIDSTEWTVLRAEGFDPVMVKSAGSKERSILIEGTPPTALLEKLRQEKMAKSFARLVLQQYHSQAHHRRRPLLPSVRSVEETLEETPCSRRKAALDGNNSQKKERLMVPGSSGGYFSFGESAEEAEEYNLDGGVDGDSSHSVGTNSTNSISSSYFPIPSPPSPTAPWTDNYAGIIASTVSPAFLLTDGDSKQASPRLSLPTEVLPTNGALESTFANGTEIPLPDGRRLPPVTAVPGGVSLQQPETSTSSAASSIQRSLSSFIREYLKRVAAAGSVLAAGSANQTTAPPTTSHFN